MKRNHQAARNISFLSYPLTVGHSPPESPLAQDDSPLSTLSPPPSLGTSETHYDVECSWSGGSFTTDEECGRDDIVVNNDLEGQNTQQVSRELTCGATPRAGTANRRYDAVPEAGASSRQVEATPKSGTANKGETTLKASTTNYEASQKAGTTSRYEVTPKAGTASRNISTRRNFREEQTTSVVTSSGSFDGNNMTTPSWDIDKTFSFRKNQEKEQDPHHQQQRSQSSFSGIWDFISAIGLSRSESMTANDDEGDNKQVGNGNAVDEPPHLTESKENDLFAMEVGLMFSVDEGDTINDPSTLYSPNFSASFTIESSDGISVAHSPAYDLAKFLRHSRQNGPGNNYPQNFDESIKDDESTIYTAGQSTVHDDHGNRVPENAKMILGYDNVQRRKTSKRDRTHINQAFPTIQKTDTVPKEMERRLRELAGQISADWRGPTFLPPTLARRLRDFQFAREKRRKKYGKAKPWGIMGLYDHLSGVKIDVEWAEDAAWRRKNKQPYLTWGDFEGMKNEGLNRPFFTFLVVSACAAMMLTSMFVNDWKFEPLSVNPMIGPNAETLLRLGAKDSHLIVVQQQVWRLASPMVLHAGLIHIFLNMFALWFVGKAIEQIHGFFPAVVQFVVPAIGGTILSAIFLPEYITVGASGGIFGLIGACISDIIMNWNLLFNEFVNERGARLSHARVLIALFFDIVLNCIIGLTPFVDNFTHLGGMIYGFLCGLSTIQLVSPRFFGDDRFCIHKCKLFFFRSFGLLVCIAGIIASSIMLFSGDGGTSPCPSCTYMSCISFPPWNEKNNKWWYCDDCSRASAEGTLDTTTGKFIRLNILCPSGLTETLGVDESWPQDEIGLEGLLPTLCRGHCY